MYLTYVSRFQFKITKEGIYSLPAYGDGFWQKYLTVFEKIHVIGEPVKEYLDDGSMVLLKDKRIEVNILPSIEKPQELSLFFQVKRELFSIISKSESLLIKPASNKGILAIKLCEKLNKPYMIEMTGDVQSALLVRKNILMKIYSNILYQRTIKSIKNCEFGLYVTETYLQKKYPIKGQMCGCTDTLLPESSDWVLEERIKRIHSYSNNSKFRIGLIGYYHDNNKGIDTAINAIGYLQKDDVNIELIILGVGTEDDRNRWMKYAQNKMKPNTLIFSEPLPGSKAVAKWIDDIDLIVLPSRSEGFPRAIAESMNRACPTITSNVCGLTELVDSKWQHKPADCKELSRLIRKMLSDKAELEESAIYNFNKSKNYRPEILRERRDSFLFDFMNYCMSYRRHNEN